MARVAFMMRLKPGCEATYTEKHDQIWPEMTALIRESGVRNYSIFRRNLDLFAYFEVDGPLNADAPISQVQRDWWLMMEPYMEYNDNHTPTIWPMDEVFHHD